MRISWRSGLVQELRSFTLFILNYSLCGNQIAKQRKAANTYAVCGQLVEVACQMNFVIAVHTVHTIIKIG